MVEFDGPVLELMTESRTRFERRLAALGPDVLAAELDERGFLARLRQDDQTRGFGDALLDQRNIAGIGNMWKAEGCFLAGLDPWRPVGEVSDDEALAVVRGVRPLMQESAAGRPAASRAGSTTAPGCPVAAATRRSAPAARATTTARPSGARRARADPGRAQGRGSRGARQHDRELRGRARARRRHDRVRRAARARRQAGAGPRLRGRRGARLPHARRGPRPLRGRARTRASRSTST